MRKILLSLLLFTAAEASFWTARAQSTYEPHWFGTLAGLGGSQGSADGTGRAARFYHPTGVAVDTAGNVYVADNGNFTIRKVTSSDVVTTIAGLAGSSGSADGTGSAARFNFPSGVAVDTAGNVYVADTSNHTIRKVTSGGVVTTLAGLAGNFGSTDGTGSAARVSAPTGVAVDSAGNVYVADLFAYTIRKITSGGVVTTLAGLAFSHGSTDGAGSAARFYDPFGMAVDSAGNVYVGDASNETIRKVTSGGIVTTLAGVTGSIGSADGTGSAARFHEPSGVAVDSAGDLYVADQYNNTIRGETALGVTAAASRKTHTGVNLGLTGTPTVEPRTGGANGSHTLVFTLSQPLASGSASVTTGSGSVAGPPMISGNQLLVNLTGVTNAQAVTVTLMNVVDTLGRSFPDTGVSAGFLFGDVNGNRSVNATDIGLTKSQSGAPVTSVNFLADLNLSGSINATDIGQVKAMAGTSIP